MAEIAEEEERNWKNKIAAVAAEAKGIFAVFLELSPPRLTIVYDAIPGQHRDGLQALFDAYKPKEFRLVLRETETAPWFLEVSKRAELLYTYSPSSFNERVRFLEKSSEQRKSELRAIPRDQDLRLVFPTIQSSVYFMIGYAFLVLGLAQIPRMGWLLKPWGLVIAFACGLGLLRLFLMFLDGTAGGFSNFIFGWKAEAVYSYSREIALAGRGKRDEAIAQLEDRFSGSQDPQALREALRVALKTPRLEEECRRLIQELLKLKSISAPEKAQLKADLASLG